MKKRQSIAVLILIAALTVFLGFTAIAGWGRDHRGSMRNIRTGLDLSGGVSIMFQAKEAMPSQADMDDTIYKLQQRVTQFSTEANVYQQGLNRINIEIPGVSDANEILTALGKPGSLSFVDEDGNEVLAGTDIAGAEGMAQSENGQIEYVVDLTMTASGADTFYEATSANVGKRISIVYDGETISSPTVNSAIAGGRAQITGMESKESADNLAAFIRIGSLSLELEEIYSNVVGASLGQEALRTSLIAGLIGILLVILFMIIVYRVSGLASGWALLIFVFLDLIFLNAFDVTLTLPGIAGVILTIGMAVDANVIIYARMREELGAGRGVRTAIQEGFRNALSAILDGNITTLIAAAVLFFLGTGSIQGFATTLAIGILLSMFTALVMSRVISNALYGAGARKKKLYGMIKKRKPINFVGKRMVFFLIAIILIVSVPLGMGVFKSKENKPLNFSLDFIGGTATTVDFGEDLSLAELDEKVEPVVSEITGDHDIQFQAVIDSTQVIIKTRELTVEERESLNAALAENFEKVDEEGITAENISSIISGEIRKNAILAVIIAVVCMLVYIWIRFRDIRFASSAVLALIHDILIVIAFYVWFRFSVGSTFIAVMLTILGYSINSTIVIFDRIRENLRAMAGKSLREIVNTSITQTLTRSIYSSLTTFLTIFVLFLMGVPSIKEFALPIIIGLIAGAFSSTCVTGPLWYVMKARFGKGKAEERKLLAAEGGLTVPVDEIADGAAKDADAKAEAEAAEADSKAKKKLSAEEKAAKYKSTRRGKKKR